MIVIARKVGRLANRLFLFAHFIAAAAEHGLIVLNPSFHPYARYFPTTARDLACRFPAARRIPPIPGSRRAYYRAILTAANGLYRLQSAGRDVGLIRLRRDQHLDLNSEAFLDVVRRHRVVFVQDWFFRSFDSFLRHRELIRTFFTPWEHHLAAAHATTELARRRGQRLVGVHVRRGDYSTFKSGRFYYTHEQYRRLMSMVESTFPGSSFLVCSDSPLPAETFAGLDVSFGNGHEVEDLYALAGCDLLIGPPSTYTSWASYYGGVPLYVVENPDAAPTPDSFVLDREFAVPASALPFG